MDSMNSMNDKDTIQFGQAEAASDNAAGAADDADAALGSAKRSGRTKRIVTSVAASAVLLGSGAAIGVALTGGASAATGGAANGTTSASSATTTAATSVAGRCARLAERLRSHGHPVASTRLAAFCSSPLLRLALVGGAHGEVTFQTKSGPKTIAVERGTIQSVTASGITVIAKDGTSWTWDFTSSTRFREAHRSVTKAQLGQGDLVLVAGPVVAGVHDASVIRIRAAG